jgi:hypothetical protein
MKNSYIIDYNKKEIVLTWRGEKFLYDLNDGDIGDFWHSLTLKDGTIKDVNFHQEEGEVPNFEIWNVITLPDGSLQIDTDEEYISDYSIIGSPYNYFNPPTDWHALKSEAFIVKHEVDAVMVKHRAMHHKVNALLEANKDNQKYCKELIGFIYGHDIDAFYKYHFTKRYIQENHVDGLDNPDECELCKKYPSSEALPDEDGTCSLCGGDCVT